MLFRIAPPLALLVSMLAAGCAGGSAPAQGAGPPPAAVELVTIESKPIPRTTEFIGTLRSLQSTVVQPEVEGLVTRIFVKPGDRVRPGDPLVQINADRQAASVGSTEANRAGTESDVEYWRLQIKRLDALVEAGAISRQEFEQAQNSLRTAEARLAALDAQLKEGRVQLQFHRVTAPQSGTIGDIAIRQGDRVTTSTEITTIDRNDALELEIRVPLDRSPDLRLGLPVEILDADGKTASTTTITFVSPRVDDATQTVLVKSAVQDPPPRVRNRQFVRARLVWSSEPGIMVPVTAVVRLSGQHFCFVAEPGPQGTLVARQKPIEVGEITGNSYIVRSGLSVGDRLIAAGIQKVADGAPVRAQ